VRRLRTWLLIGLAAVVAVAAAAVVLLPRLVDTPRVQALLARTVGHALGRPVRFASVHLRVWPPPAVVVRDLEIAEDPAFGARPFVRVQDAEVRLRLLPLLALRVELGDVVLKRPLVSLVQAPDGRWNVASLGAPPGAARSAGRARGSGPAAAAALASRVRVQDGVLTWETRAGGAPVRYRVEGLDLTLSAGAGGVAFAGDATVLPGDLALTVADGTLTVDGTRALAEAPVRATVAVDGRRLRELVALALGPDPSVEGAVKGTFALEGTLGAPRASGTLTLTDLAVSRTQPACPEPRRRTLALGTLELHARWADGRLVGQPLRSGLAGGELTATLTATLDPELRVALDDLVVRGVPVETILVDFLCQGYAVTGPLQLEGRVAARPADLWRTLEGRGRARIGPGRVVGPQALGVLGALVRLGGEASGLLGVEPTAPLDFDAITATYTIDRGVVTTRDFRFAGRALTLTAAGTYALATGALNLDVAVVHGRTRLTGRVTGTADHPTVRITPAGLLESVDPEAVERGLRDLLRRFR